MENQPIRVNTRISSKTNDWLDKKSAEMALSKSSLINLAIENYRTQVESMDALPKVMKKLEELGIDINK